MSLDDRLDPVLREIEARAKTVRGRVMVAVAGPPGAGKSTFAEALAALVTHRTTQSAAVVAQDGFHLDNAVLDRLDLRARKGAPETFDVDGLLDLLKHLRHGAADVSVPTFDRRLDRVREAAAVVPAATDIVIVEGNYLLLDMAPWDRLRGCFDLTIMLACPFETLRSRLVERWLRHGLAPEAAAARAESNDLVNARLVAAHSAPADLRVMAD